MNKPVRAGQEEGFKKHTILVVEDEVLIRLYLSEELRQTGFVVIEASSADEAFAILNTNNDVALLLTDLRMPGEYDGAELIKWVRQEIPQIKIVMISATCNPSMEALVDAAFSKPFVFGDVLRSVRQLLPPREQAGSAES